MVRQRSISISVLSNFGGRVERHSRGVRVPLTDVAGICRVVWDRVLIKYRAIESVLIGQGICLLTVEQRDRGGISQSFAHNGNRCRVSDRCC